MSYFCLKTISFFIVTFLEHCLFDLISFRDLFPPGVHCALKLTICSIVVSNEASKSVW